MSRQRLTDLQKLEIYNFIKSGLTAKEVIEKHYTPLLQDRQFRQYVKNSKQKKQKQKQKKKKMKMNMKMKMTKMTKKLQLQKILAIYRLYRK